MWEIILERDHKFKARDPKAKRKLCEHCGHGRHHASLVHHGHPPSLNLGGSGWNPMAFQGIKAAWENRITQALLDVGVPKGLERLACEGQVCFPDRIRRDQGNMLFFVHKALGDALTHGGWLEDDSFFPVVRFELAGLTATYSKGRSYTRLMLMELPAHDVTEGEQLALEAG